jgi:hypothetical protein
VFRTGFIDALYLINFSFKAQHKSSTFIPVTVHRYL